MELRIFAKQSPQFDSAGNGIYYQGSSPNTLNPIVGTLPNARQWSNYGQYIDITADVESDLFKTLLTWTAQADNEGFITPGVRQRQKGASGGISIGGNAYQLIKRWLVEDVSAALNTVDVIIKHIESNGKECGRYENYIIKATDLVICDDGICAFDVVLKQADELYNCIRSTLISDNWQGWFQLQGKKHPRFSYCNEQRPNGMMITTWYITNMVVVPTLQVLIPILAIVNIIFGILNGIIGFIRLVGSFFGGTPPDDPDENIWRTIPYFNFKGMADSIGAYFVESAGCGREFPAPLIRDYIQNVCDKCGVRVDASTAPLFFSQQITFDANSGNVTQYNDYYNACYLNADVARGIRRFKSLNALRGLPNNTDFYQVENRPILSLDQFLDKVLPVFNHEWSIFGGALYIDRKDKFSNTGGQHVLDLRFGTADRAKIVEGICYEWNENKIPAWTEGVYSTDAADKPGNEAKDQQNGFVQFGDASKVKVFDGMMDKKTPFGAVKFRQDGASEDYIMDAFQIVINGGALTPFIPGFMFDFVKPAFVEYADHALLIQDETISLPKIIIWDGQSYENAKAAKFLAAWPITGYSNPDPNMQYNPNPDNWWGYHNPKTFVRGAGLTLPPSQPGYYLVTDFFGAREWKVPALLPNYSMYFAPQFKGGLWDRFHWIDDPNKRAPALRTFKVKLELCCDLLQRLKLFGDGSSVVLGDKVYLPDNKEGVINQITVSYAPDNVLGMYVEIQGNVNG